MKDWLTPEELEPELARHLQEGPLGTMIHHRLVIEISYHSQFNRMYNQQFRKKTEVIRKASETGDWVKYVFLHERPYRLEAFMEIEEHVPDDHYWSLVHSIWIDTENAGQNLMEWLDIWHADRPGREGGMSDQEREHLAQLPPMVEVWRGARRSDHLALSWSLNKKKAMWFARRFAKKGERLFLMRGLVKKEDILAVILGRNEWEVVSDKVKVTTTTYLPRMSRKRVDAILKQG